MGVNLGHDIPRHEIELKDLANREIAIDAFNTLYQFLTTIRQPDGTPLRDSKGRVTSHLSGIFYRTINLIEAGIKPIFVFDGVAPAFKHATQAARSEIKKEAEIKWKAAMEAGDTQEARKYAGMSTRLTSEMIESSKELMEAMGLSWVQAPSEGEAQAAYMCKVGDVHAAASQDYDALLFGSPILIRNVTSSGKRKLPFKKTMIEVKPEMLKLDEVLKSLGLNQEQFIAMGILIGTDYNPKGIDGMGSKRALAHVKKYVTFKRIFAEIKWPFDITPEEIRDFFLNPPVEKKEITKGKFDPEKIKKMLVDDYEFSQERIDKGLERIKEATKGGQTSLGKWLRR